MYNSLSLASVYLATVLICSTDFANGVRELEIPVRRPGVNISRVERENPKWLLSKRFQFYDDNKVTRKFLNVSDFIVKANNLRFNDLSDEPTFGKRSFLGKNHRLFHRNRFRQATSKIKSFFEIVDHLPPANFSPSTKLNRRVTAMSVEEASPSSSFHAGKVVLFTRNNVTFPTWMLNAVGRFRSIATPVSSNLRIPTFPCPTFGEMWNECTAARKQRHYPRTLSRRTCTIPRGFSPRSLNRSDYFDRTRIWPRSMPYKCSSPASTVAFWRTKVDCASASPRMLQQANDKYCLFSCTFPRTTGCCTDPTSTCSEPTSTEHETAWCTDPTSTPFLPRLYMVTSIDRAFKQNMAKQDIIKPYVPKSGILKQDIPKHDIITPYIPKSGITIQDIPKLDISQPTIPRPAARGANEDRESNISLLIRKKCRCKCTPPTSTCTPPTSTCVESSADDKPPTPSVVPCQCQPAKVEEATTCKSTTRAVDPATSATASTVLGGKVEKICTCKTECALKESSCKPEAVKSCCRHSENCPLKKAKCKCHCQKAKHNNNYRCQKAKSNCHCQKANSYGNCQKDKNNCHCQKEKPKCPCQKDKSLCHGQVKRKLKRDVGGDEVKGDFVVFKAITGEWLDPSCLASTIGSASTGNPFNSILLYLSWPDSQNRTKFSVEINGDGQSAANYLNTQFRYLLLFGGLNILITIFIQ